MCNNKSEYAAVRSDKNMHTHTHIYVRMNPHYNGSIKKIRLNWISFAFIKSWKLRLSERGSPREEEWDKRIKQQQQMNMNGKEEAKKKPILNEYTRSYS